MTTKIEAPCDIIENIIKSLYDTVRGDDDIPMDINLVCHPEDYVEIYVRSMNSLQVLHTIYDGDHTTVDVDNRRELVFTSETFYKLINNADNDFVEIEFEFDDFIVSLSDSWFSTPSEFTLPLFHESEFQQQVSVNDSFRIGTIEVNAFQRQLKMMESIAPVVAMRVEDGEFWLSVSDRVVGAGEVMKDLDGLDDTKEFEYKFNINPITTFLSGISSTNVELSIHESGGLTIESTSHDVTSELMLANRRPR
ncbi:hypothetical protein GJ631_15040 [Natronomonas sp. CBA1123]|uniref:hypothetical protein n=1 Tax=Natronomonas sp. CBA1123 TaxID=2668070 RepID=UPI0012EABC58|nr:hypothetical protein [Natronomonas sp. CBA1123]MUV87831.1 hypothetical protein [Natronomonas sp. CBA1123]